ncbi:lactate utilization protein [uncultured Mitsuokella sp.]|uniref:lactate utilization protein n=1 Tax=uncultured Mitsuokella sp. TaxID=453120 RepID=UPI0026DBE543|nr:lactate utilization protein [uncultured Mitsuokella sp.]
MEFSTLAKNLEKRGYRVTVYRTKEEAAAYLDATIRGKTVGMGGSVTLNTLGLYEKLQLHNKVYWHWRQKMTPEAAKLASYQADVYLSSLNGVAETGELVNIDGNCNRVAATLAAHERVCFVVGRNKVAPTLEAAIHRARNIAAPKNAQRLGCKTPCAVKADHCYDCKSPERICRMLNVLWDKPLSKTVYEVVLIDEDLGY